MGAGGPLGIVIYLSRFPQISYDINFILGILLHTHKYTHSVQIQTHMDRRFYISCVAFPLSGPFLEPLCGVELCVFAIKTNRTAQQINA